MDKAIINAPFAECTNEAKGAGGAAGKCWTNNTQRINTMKPSSIDPVSPMYIFAGAKLKNNRPMVAPQRLKDMPARTLDDCSANSAPSNAVYNTAVTPARPSMPSMKLNTLIKKVHASVVTTILTSQGSSSKPAKP